MSARVDGLLPAVARELGVEIVGSLAGGEFGAVIVLDGDGQELVLKAMPGERWAPMFARGAALCARVPYRVPRYAGTGVAAGASWTLQERLPGEVPPVMTEAHARQLLAFVRTHAGAAGQPGDDASRWSQELAGAIDTLVARADTAELARALAAALPLPPGARHGDVVHSDYHHRNFLADGDDITGVFDWDFAYPGDWRIDLVNLAVWSSWTEAQVDDGARALVVAAAVDACEPAILACYSAVHTLRSLEFFVRVHPDRVPWFLAAIDRTTRAWLDGAGR